jgi:hypothetical protein
MNLLAKIKMWVGKPQAHPKTGAMQDTSGFTVTVPASLVRLAAPMDVSARAATTIPAKHIVLDVVDFTHHRSVEAQTDIVHALNAIVQSSVQCENIPQEKILFLPRGDNIGIVLWNVEAPEYPYDTHLHIALSILSGMHAYNEHMTDAMRQFQVRIGLNAHHDTLVTDINDQPNIAGAGINMAARIMRVADGNQILVGRAVYDILQRREKYLQAFTAYEATVKPHLVIPVYQFVASGHLGLNTDTPRSLQTPQAPTPNTAGS